MAVVLDLLNRTPGRATPRKRTGPDQPVLRKPDWIRVKAPGSPQWAETSRIVRENKPRHRLRGGGLPEYRRVLGEEARHLHDHGRHLHAGLRLLQREDRPAAARSIRTSRRASPTPSRSSAWRMSSSPRSTATISPTAARSISRQVIRAIRARSPDDDDRGPDAGLPAQGRRARDRRRGQARRLQPQSRNGAVEVSDRPPRRALFPLDPAAAAGEGARSDDLHQVRHHGRPRRGAERGAAAHGRPALRRGRFPHHRPISAADAQAPSGDRASSRRTSSRPSRRSPTPRASCWSRRRPLTRSSHHAGEDFAKLKAARAVALGD